jgi:transglutaminase/protease-like cytokinesis protein 3
MGISMGRHNEDRFVKILWVICLISVLLAVFSCIMPVIGRPQAYESEITYERVEEIEAKLIECDSFFIVRGVSKQGAMDLIDIAFDHPETFGFEMEYTIRTIHRGVYLVTFDHKYKNVDDKLQEVSDITDQILAEIITDDMTDFEKVHAIHDWICNNISYERLPNNDDQELYAALTKRKTVCAGYAKLFSYMLSKVGIESDVISGSAVCSNGATIPHAWNVAIIDGGKYYFDLTWDDKENEISYKWFGVSEDVFMTVHIPSRYYQILFQNSE